MLQKIGLEHSLVFKKEKTRHWVHRKNNNNFFRSKQYHSKVGFKTILTCSQSDKAVSFLVLAKTCSLNTLCT